MPLYNVHTHTIDVHYTRVTAGGAEANIAAAAAREMKGMKG